MDFGGNNKMYYFYDPAGGLMQRAVCAAGHDPVLTSFFGPFVREGTQGGTNNLKYILTPEGRIMNYGTDHNPVWKWESQMKHSFWEHSEPKADVELVPMSHSDIGNLADHLGNVRLVLEPGALAGTATVLQENHYYPFGMRINELSTSSGTNNPYLYNNKELQTGFGLNWYNYIARFYDPEVPRFTGVDPLAEERQWLSPYIYCSLNPINRIDPDGAFDTDFKDKDGKTISHIEDGSNAVFQLTGNSRSEEYFKFTGYDEKQGGENKVNVESAIKGSQDYTREKYTSDINDKGICTQTYCNYGTMNIAKTYESAMAATGQKADISDIKGSARDIGGKLAASKVVTPATDLAAAQKAAKAGSFVVGYWPGHVFTLNKQGLINNVGAPRPKNNVFDPKYTEGKGQKFYIIQVPKAQYVAPK
jgi:RHS repeat-associated protein